MIAHVSDIIAVLESYAPLYLAESWDNAGLQVGKRNWPVERIWVSLDPGLDVVRRASAEGVNMLVTHHPLIFKPVRNIDFSTPLGQVIERACQNQMAIYAAHTNLDSAIGGMNDSLAQRLGVTLFDVLSPLRNEATVKLVLFTSAEHRQQVLGVLFDAGGSIQEIYSVSGIEKNARHHPGDHAETEPEYNRQPPRRFKAGFRIEAAVSEGVLKTVLIEIQRHLQDMDITYDVYPLKPLESGHGMGRIGRLDAPVSLEQLARRIKNILGIDGVRIAGDPRLQIETVALCTGSGSGLMDLFIGSGANAFISGDLRYHDAQTTLSTGKGLIDIGHFASEHIVVDDLTQRLLHDLASSGFNISVQGCPFEKDPFVYI